jgi:hypothetical protein
VNPRMKTYKMSVGESQCLLTMIKLLNGHRRVSQSTLHYNTFSMTKLAMHNTCATASAAALMSSSYSQKKYSTDYHTIPTISSDDMSAREDFLLMLVSTVSGSTLQQRNQKRALTMLQACGVQPEILDAADPSNALVRDELCELSGMQKGQYPQFFLVQGDRTEFFADFAELEHMNEEGTLAEWLGMEIPVKSRPTSPPKAAVFPSPHPAASSDDYFYYTKGKDPYGDNDDRTETTHPATSQAGSSFDSHSVAHPNQQVQLQHSFDPMIDDEKEENLDEHFEKFQRNGYQVDSFDEQSTLPEGGCGTHFSPHHPNGNLSHSQDSPPRSPREDSVIYSEMSSPRQELPPAHDVASLKKRVPHDIDECVAASTSQAYEDSLFHKDLYEDNLAAIDHSGHDTQLHSLNSLLSSDESVDTTATASSIVTNSRMTSMDLDLCIQPSMDIHFRLTHCSEDTSRCTLTLTNRSMSYLPLAFKIQASQRQRYMVWPSVGVVKPQNTTSVTVFLLDDAKQGLLESFRKLGPAAEFLCTDTLLIDWCAVPTDFCNQLAENHDQDLEILLSYWNSCRKDEGWSCEKSYLRVRVSVDDRNKQVASPHVSASPVRAIVSETYENVPHSTPFGSAWSTSPFEMDDSYKMLQAEIENLRRKCEEMTAERYILEQQLEDARERESPNCGGGAIHKFQLQQTMRCGRCLKVFRSDANSVMAPIASQSCGHSICRNCCFGRSSRYRRRPKHSLSSDLLMCVGDMQSFSFEDDSCPICHAPAAFAGPKLHVNHSLCLVLKLLD